MSTVSEVLKTIEAEQQLRSARKEQSDIYQKFYKSRAWRAARYQYLKTQPKPLRCACCGATSREVRLACDHVIPIKTEEGWKRRLTGPFQMLCAGNEGCAGNLAKGSHDSTYFGETASEPGKEDHADAR
jgi:hypothetical protein